RLVNEDPARPSSLSSYVDPKLEEVCLKAISKKPEGRYQSAREMRAALRVIADARGAAETTPTPSPAARQPMQAAAAPTLPALAPFPNAEAKRARRALPSWFWVGAGAAGAIGIAFFATQTRAPPATAPAGLVASVPARGALEVPSGEPPPAAE